MQSTNFEYGSPYLTIHHIIIIFILLAHVPHVSVSLSLQLFRYERPHVQQSCSVRTHQLDLVLVRILWFWWNRLLRPPQILYRRSFTAALMFPLWSLHTAASGGSKSGFLRPWWALMFDVFERRLLCSSRLRLFDKKHSIKSKYYCNLK